MRNRSGLAVLLLTVVAAVLRLPNLGESFWFDEVFYSTHQAASSLSQLWGLFLTEPPAPLYTLVLFWWVEVFGEGEVTARLPSLLFGVASIALSYRIARAYGSPWVAVVAAAFLCVSPVHAWYSQEATPYAMTLFFVLVTVLAWLRLHEDSTRAAWLVVYGVGLAATVVTHYLAALLLLPLTLMSLSLEPSSRRHVLTAHAVIAAGLVLAFAVKLHAGHVRSGQGFLRAFTPFEWWMLFFHWFVHGNALWTVHPYRATAADLTRAPMLVACQAFFALLFVRGLVSYRARSRPAWELLALTCAAPVVMVLLALGGYRQLYIERYLLVLLPFVAIVLARGAASFPNVTVAIACAAAMVVIGAASYGAWLSKPDTWTVYKPNPDWRAAVRYLDEQPIPSSETVIAAAVPTAELEYYLPRERGGPAPRIVRADLGGMEALLGDRRAHVLHVVENDHWTGRIDEVLRQLKDDTRWAFTTSRSFKGLKIHTFRSRGAAGDERECGLMPAVASPYVRGPCARRP